MRYRVDGEVGTNKATLAYPDGTNGSVENCASAIDKGRRSDFEPRAIVNVDRRLEVRGYSLARKAFG